MRKWQLQGYVSPKDFTGTDAERLQNALCKAKELDICRVTVDEKFVCDKPVLLPDNMHLVLEADLAANIICQGEANFSLARKNIFIESCGGSLRGNITCFNTEKTVLKGLSVTGDVYLAYSSKIRMEDCAVSGRLTVARGTENSIFQHLTAGEVLVTAASEYGPIAGREDTVKNIFLRNITLTRGSVTLIAEKDAGLACLLVDNITAPEVAVIVGDSALPLPPERYEGLSLCELTAPEPLRLNGKVLRCFLRP